MALRFGKIEIADDRKLVLPDLRNHEVVVELKQAARRDADATYTLRKHPHGHEVPEAVIFSPADTVTVEVEGVRVDGKRLLRKGMAGKVAAPEEPAPSTFRRGKIQIETTGSTGSYRDIKMLPPKARIKPSMVKSRSGRKLELPRGS